MIVRLVLGIGLAALTYWLLRRVLGKYQLSVKQFFAIYGLALGALILVALAISGRLHPVAAALGVALTMGARLLPWIMRGLQAMNLLRAFGAMRNAQSVHRGPKDGATSEVMSEFLSMKLDHDAGSIDGQVLKGSFKGARLSALKLEDLLQLRGELAVDDESLQLLDAFLSREYPDWDEQREAHTDDEATDEFQAALNCLELTWPCTESEVITAHRRLIQKHHPDHGGSHERAAALNSAKALLIETIRRQEGSSS